MRGRVFVELQNGSIIRIFRNSATAVLSKAWEERRVEEYPRREAVQCIRAKVFKDREGLCKYCGKYAPFDGDVYSRGHLHEELPRGRGGEISIFNSVWACYDCHKHQHPEKQLRFGEHELRQDN